MNTHSLPQNPPARLLALLTLLVAGLLLSAASVGQVPVDENGNPIAAMDETGIASTSGDPQPELLTAAELQALVGPIALYPDDLLAIVLPASTYPLEIVQAARFLEAFEEDKTLQPDDAWDESITALLNYPEVIELMNDDLDWTWRLGEAVVSQQPDVIAAVEAFRDRAYAAGNLKTDDRQVVSNNDGIIEIAPANEEIIYVPYYEPERVVVYQPRPAYYYYPRPYPVYYYPYPHGYNFYSNYFWGVTTAYAIGWNTHHLHVFHHSYWGHPYYGRSYYGNWYRRPSITVYNNWYGDGRSEVTRDHYRDGDFWRPRHSGGARPGFHRSRVDNYRDGRRATNRDGYRDRAQIAQSNDRGANRTAADGNANAVSRVNDAAGRAATNRRQASGARLASDSAGAARDAPIRFRQRAAGESTAPVAGAAGDTQRLRDNAAAAQAVRRDAGRATLNRRSTADDAIRFRPRDNQPGTGVRGQRNAESTSARSSNSNTALRLEATQRAATRRSEPSRAQPVTRAPQRSPAPRMSAPRSAPAPAVTQPPRSAPTRAAPRAAAPRAAAPRVSAPRAAAPAAAPRATSRAAPARPATRNDRTRDR